MALKFYPLTIAGLRQEGEDAIAIRFDVPEALQEVFTFIPGQYLTLRAMIDGEDVRRSYSICCASGERELEVGVKPVENGRFSAYAETLKPGDKLDVMPPQGRFLAPIGGAHDYLLIAAGSGITPVLAIAKSVLAQEPESRVALIYGNRKVRSIMFRADLEALKDRYLERFSVVHILSREGQEVALLNGRIDADKLRLLTEKGVIDPASYDGIYLCGPQPMIESATAALKALGAAPERIHHELFLPADGGAIDYKKRAEKAAKAAGDVRVEAVLDGARHAFRMDGRKQTVLAAAKEAGIELPFSCAGGMCCTCRCRLTEGEAEMDTNYSLRPWEIEAGFILACQARPKTARLVLDFDAV